MIRCRLTLVAALVAGVVCAPPILAQTAPLSGLDGYIEQVRRDWGVVGLAVAVVKDDSVVYARGFGFRTQGTAEPVDAHTLFAIGSNTKAFTGAGLGILVDDERLGWDDHVIDHLPAFQLFDPYVTREITVRDLLAHRSGLGRRGDANWYGTDFDRDEVVRRIRFLAPNASFRAEFGYQNTMFLAAGEVIEAVTGVSWDQWMAERLFRPLDMSRSNTTTRALANAPNVAAPHVRRDGKTWAVPYRNLDNIAAAGSINSCVLDMARWMRMLLNGGELEGRRVLSAEVVREMATPQTLRPLTADAREMFPSTHFAAYGLGLGLRDYRGRLVISHTGGIDGMLSQVTLVPEERLGIVILTNTAPNNAFSAITFHLVDGYLGAGGRDWNAAFLEEFRQQDARVADARQQRLATRAKGTKPSLPLASYAATYEDPMYGRATVRLEQGKLVLQRHTALVGDLEHWHYDTFRVNWRDPVLGDGMVTFVLNGAGEVRTMSLENVAEFARVPAPPTPRARP